MDSFEPVETLEHLAPVPGVKSKIKIDYRIVGAVLVVMAAFAGFWYKTNSWPIVAMVGMRPVTRFEVTQELFKQYGKDALENKVTEMLVKNELDRTGVSVSDTDVTAKIDEIKGSLTEGTDLDSLLASRGMTKQQFEYQLRLQLRVEKALMAKINITDQEVSDYLKANEQYMTASGEAALTQAKEAVKYSKLQEEVNKWLEELKTKAKVWRAPGV